MVAASPNPVANHRVTEQAVRFVETLCIGDIPDEALRIGRRCILDSLGLFVAGADEDSVRILAADAEHQGGRPEALLLGAGDRKVPAAAAARVLGTAGHAHDWDDTQVSNDPGHVYGLLTHPSVPVLAAALATAQQAGGVSGERLMVAFQAGVEVECKISEWMLPEHYKRGFHSSGTVGTFGACIAAAKIIGLDAAALAHAIGIAASMAAGIRCNFGTMTKPLHVGRAAENGVVAAGLAARGFTADPEALDSRWGFMHVAGGGVDERKVSEGFGRIYSIVEPGVSIKPYPSGILTHQSMDAMLRLVKRHDLKPEQVKAVRFFAGSNILAPIRYPIAANHLQAKFCMAALLSMIILFRKAGKQEFTDRVVQSKAMQDMQARISIAPDPAIEAQGFDKIRSRIEVTTVGGEILAETADERYRGGPSLPMTDDEIAGKVADCAAGTLDPARTAALIEAAGSIESLVDAAELARLMQIDHGTRRLHKVAGE